MEKIQDYFEELQKKEGIFWLQEYPTKTLEEKQKFWFKRFFVALRPTKGDDSIDKYYLFYNGIYQVWLEKEPLLNDIILDYVADKVENMLKIGLDKERLRELMNLYT